jgi:hypothetical protein
VPPSVLWQREEKAGVETFEVIDILFFLEGNIFTLQAWTDSLSEQ